MTKQSECAPSEDSSAWASAQSDQSFRGVTFQCQNQLVSRDMTKQSECAPSENSSAWASAQSDQSFRCSHEETLGP